MPSTTEMIEKYVALRDKKKAIADRHAEELKPYNDAMTLLEGALALQLQEQGVESMRTEAGTVYQTRITVARVADREKFVDWLFDQQDAAFVMSAVPKDAVEEWMKDRDGEVPPGVEVSYRINTNVRRAS